MTDYIERDRLMSEIEKSVEAAAQDGNLVVADAFETMRDLVYAFPTADVKPVVRGRWEWRHRHRGGFRRMTGEDDFGVRHTITVDERYQIDDPYCSVCGKLNESVFLNYCSNCGAEMVTDCNQLEEDEG